MPLPYAQTVALITGANRGIGLALVEALLQRGTAKIYAGARSPDTLRDLVARAGGRVVPLQLDVTDLSQIAAAAELAADTTLLINNAGVATRFGAALTDPAILAEGQNEWNVNVQGVLRMTQAFAPVLAANGGGAIVNLGSVVSFVNIPAFITYSMSKAAVHSLTQATRAMLAAQGTRVHGVYPGPIDTDMAKDIPMQKVTPAEAAGRILDGIAAGDEEIYPDPFAEQIGAAYQASPKALERQMAQQGAA